MKKKPRCKLIGTDGNVFSLAAKVRATLKKAKMDDEFKEFSERLLQCKSYEESLCLMMEYVDVY